MPLFPYYIKLCASFQIHRWIHTRVTVRKTLNLRQNLWFFLACMTLKFDRWHWKILGHLFYTTFSIVHHIKAIGQFKLQLQSIKTLYWGRNRPFFALCDLEIRWMTFLNNRSPFLYHIKLCASFQSHRWIQTWASVWKRLIRIEIGDFFCPVWP